MSLADKTKTPPNNLQELFDKAIKFIHEKKGYKPSLLQEKEIRALIDETYNVFYNAMSFGIKGSEIPEEMLTALKTNIFQFSGFKTHQQMKEVGKFLLDDKEKVKPFSKFKQDVAQVSEDYNKNYLKAEYQFAIASSQSAARWSEYSEDTERYMLQYRTANDDKVRQSHQSLHEVTLPKSDPFWKSFYPPNGWRCRCTVVEVLASKYEKSDSKTAITNGEVATTRLNKEEKNTMEMFRFNPGQKSIVFPEKHPYYKDKKEVLPIINKMQNGK